MLKITAVCDEVDGCPLYRRGSRLEFTPPTVSGADGLPLCAAAIEAMRAPVDRVALGEAPASFPRIYCGGCDSGKAWWNLESELSETKSKLSPAASQMILNQLSRMKLFAGIHAAKLTRIVKLFKGMKVDSGAALVTRGRPGDAFYVVLEGECEVIAQDEEGHESVLATLPAGECFGEMSLITGEPTSATVRARDGVTVLAANQENFNAILGVAPEIAITLARILAHRLASTGRRVMDELKKGLAGRLDLISPAELIQAINVNSQTGMLVVQNADQSMSIYLHDGQVHEVKMGDKSGEEAFYEFLGWARGNFRFEAVRREASTKQVQMDTVGLLIEGMRRVDEYKQTGVWRKES